jgi:peptidoglycan hydrolase-like protein with peptidoglycan-binding domain
MKIVDVQRILAQSHLYTGPVDGAMQPLTVSAVLAMLEKSGVNPKGWSDERLSIAAMQAIARAAKIETGAIDGFLGPQTRHALEVYEARAKNGGKPVAAVENWRDDRKAPQAKPTRPLPAPITSSQVNAPSKVPAWPLQSRMTAFYGPPGSGQVSLTLPYVQRLAWDLSSQVTKVSCHRRVRENFERIFARTLDHYGIDAIRELRLDRFGGCLNVRKMRGGSAWSMHSWGCAWDMDPDHNPLKAHRAQATLDNPDYDPFWRFVYDEGAISLGRERDYDWMHFQFARL